MHSGDTGNIHSFITESSVVAPGEQRVLQLVSYMLVLLFCILFFPISHTVKHDYRLKTFSVKFRRTFFSDVKYEKCPRMAFIFFFGAQKYSKLKYFDSTNILATYQTEKAINNVSKITIFTNIYKEYLEKGKTPFKALTLSKRYSIEFNLRIGTENDVFATVWNE